MATAAQKRVNLVVSRIIPPVLLGAIIYASYAITKTLCIDYLIHPLPSYHQSPRVGAGAVIVALYYLLLIPVVSTYIRLLYNVFVSPGYLPLGAERVRAEADSEDPKHKHGKRRRRKSSSRRRRDAEKNGQADAIPDVDLERGINNHAGGKAYQLDSFGLESFYTKDVFVCQEDGRPPWCSSCCQFKTDRAHHCREVDRCVRKMDHFCPWVGGVVSETSFKFFIQFVVYTAIFCGYLLIVTAYYTAEIRRNTGGANAYWAVCIGLSALFAFFSAGMSLSSIQMAMMNLTTIENINRHSVVWTLAIRVPDHMLDRLWATDSPWAPTFRTVSYPLQPPSSPSQPQTTSPSPDERHVFAILHTLPGENPFSLGSPLKNLQQVMGHSISDWLLPLKHSPCADHSSSESAFALGPVVTRLKQEAGLVPAPAPESGNGAISRPPTARVKRSRRVKDRS
ncbi:Palmitoyltransferase pfa5 [Penicillium cataractarum]|uniref:Palmitoyltransferase n=1 Tax=Penicillium cataractarum TaxID=2100454 RepID=A0A9W9SPB3_9EURO|nr:Palmitoyltransferase pfa5 [Penicillium cataractarum]KAJ5381660.1 Palmitoyltransferase pfa5 [Penicillium cataractarum]